MTGKYFRRRTLFGYDTIQTGNIIIARGNFILVLTVGKYQGYSRQSLPLVISNNPHLYSFIHMLIRDGVRFRCC